MRADADPLRRGAERRGRRAESLAAWYLRLKLYRVLARRYRTPAGEIDLIVRRGRTLVFVEVKHRDIEEDALDAVGNASRRRIARAAALWIAAHPGTETLDRRYDIVVMRPRRLPRHLPGMFGDDGAPW